MKPPDAEPLTGKLPLTVALLAREVYVDDIIGGCPTVHLTPPDGPPIRFTLTAEAARVLGIALLSSAEISMITGWGVVAKGPMVADSPTAVAEGPLYDDATARAVLDWAIRPTTPPPPSVVDLTLSRAALDSAWLTGWAIRAANGDASNGPVGWVVGAMRRPVAVLELLGDGSARVRFEEVAEGPPSTEES